MSIQEQKSIKEQYYNEAMRYIYNAKDTLKKSSIEYNKFYKDTKYTRSACGIAYLGVLKALDGYLLLKDVPLKKSEKNIDMYRKLLAKTDKKLLLYLNNVYQIFHIDGYYGELSNKKIIRAAFEDVQFIINKIKP